MNIREQVVALQQIRADAGKATHKDTDEIITVSAATRRMAFAYERFRNVLEPDEADILRRKAIWRMLDRRIHQDKPHHVMATAILQELTRAHYIEGLSASYIAIVAEYIRRAAAVYPHLKPGLADLFLDIVAVAIDRHLYPRQREEGFVQLMYQDTYQRTVWADDLLSSEEQPVQLYIACHRSLFAADDKEIMYHFFLSRYPWWRKDTLSEEEITLLGNELSEFLVYLNSIMHHPARERLYRILRPMAVPYRILWDLMQTNGEAIFSSEEELASATQAAIGKRIEHIQKRMGRRAWHSILFLFFTKTLIAIFIELPYELFLFGRPHWLALSANIAFHPLLLFFAGTSARMPGASNTEKIGDQVQRLVNGEDPLPTIVITKPRRYGAMTWALFATVYTALFMLMFWRLFSLLDSLQFSILAIVIFVVFLGLVSFLATRIRRQVEDIRVLPKKEGAFGLFVSFLSLPILEFGRYLTAHISQLNVFLFLMDLVLEAPFKFFIDVIEEWFTFIRDRKEEIV
ncbi:MAG: hypothetical protein HYZ63_03170 [Candidatus Andersenbacteria bacterium]|nr:hypothetical protein [Candidatus Andersenbacteria bacterium]